MQAILFFIYTASLAVAIGIFYISLRRSEFGVLLLTSEFLFFGLGLFLYPILYIVGLIDPGATGKSFLRINGDLGLFAALHIFGYSIFSGVGYHFATKRRYLENFPRFRRLRLAFGSPKKLCVFLIGFGFLIYAVFIYIVGFDVALANAFAARSGNFEGFGDDVKFLFLKTLGGLSLYAVCFFPWLLIKKKNKFDYLLIFLYIGILLFAYLNSISRGLLLGGLFAPYLVYLRARHPKSFILRGLIIMIPAFVVLVFGKTFGFYMASLISGDHAELSRHHSDDSYLLELFQNVEFAWYSIEAGIRNFQKDGPLFPQDVIYSIIGFIPVKVLEYFGLGNLYYGEVAVRLPCVNTHYFGGDPCTIPPLWAGYSAYFLPIGGGMIFGYLKFFVLGRIEMMWVMAKNIDYSLTWIPYLFFAIAVNLFTLIPTTIAPTVLVILLIFFYISGRRIMAGIKRRNLPATRLIQ